MRRGASGNIFADARGARADPNPTAPGGRYETRARKAGSRGGAGHRDLRDPRRRRMGPRSRAGRCQHLLSGRPALRVRPDHRGVHRCGDRAELLETTACPGGPWGLDFPFALPAWTYPKFSNRDWPDLLEFANNYEEAQISYLIRAAGLDNLEDECPNPGGACRVTDAKSGALSPIKRYRPSQGWGGALTPRLRGRGGRRRLGGLAGRGAGRLFPP
jgi:hypothetical protein